MSKTGRYTRETGVVTPLESPASSNPVDSGWFAVRARQAMAGNFRLGFISSGLEATVKDCGVAVARPQGQSRVPSPLTGQQ